MKLLIDDIKLDLLLEKKKKFIGKSVTWDSLLSACSFLISVFLASYQKILFVPGNVLKTLFVILGIGFTIKSIWDIKDSRNNSYTYKDLLADINKLNEITHNHSIVAIRDEFNKYPNRFLVYDDMKWGCLLFLNYKENMNNENFIIDHLSRELKIESCNISVEYKGQKVSEKISGRDHINKVYSHRLFLVSITDFPEIMKKDTFELDGRTYYWKSIVELEQDKIAMENNEDIISFVRDCI